MKHKTYEAFTDHLRKIADIYYATAVLHWDKEVNMPDQGVALRTRQLATLEGIAHELFTSDTTGRFIKELEQEKDQLPAIATRNLELCNKDFQRAQRLDQDFVIRRSKLVSAGYHAWINARKENDFAVFAPALEALVQLKKEEAERIGYEEHPYNALLDQYEPDYRAGQLDRLFADVRNQLVDFAQQLRAKPQVDDAFLRRNYPAKKQWDFGLELLKRIGYDFSAGRQDKSVHPFTINFGSKDVRVTTRIDEQNFESMTWSCIHEGGHALYEQGIPTDWYGLPIGLATSLGIHESQSRLWENNVGRSLPFWKGQYALAQQFFPEQLREIDLMTFYKGINKVEPSPIRIESDELHYHFHVMIRYEIEKALIEGQLKAADIPEAWNSKYKAYLDLDIPDDKTGALQDIHWAHGSIGYFPTYSLGSFYAAQFFAQAKKDIPDLIQQLESGETKSMLEWLRTNIHQHGKIYSADELCQRITGESLNFKYFMDYAKDKFGRIYGL